MAILQGSVIQAADFTLRSGVQASNRAFPSQAAAISKMSALYGVGWGDRGYGQPLPEIPQIRSGSLVRGSDWQAMVTALNTCAAYLGVSIANVPDASVYQAGSDVDALTFDWLTAIAQIDAVRLTPDVNNLGNQLLLVDSRFSPWTVRPELTVDVDFGTEDAARAFFNCGGQIVISCDYEPDVSDAHNNSWAQLINQDTGTIRMGAYETTRLNGTPSQGVLNDVVGYYTLTPSFNTLFSISPLTAPFNVNTLSMSVQTRNAFGVNGGNGSVVRLTVYFDDAYGGPFEAVTGTLNVNISVNKPNQYLQVANPNVNVIQDLEGGGGSPYYPFTDVISTSIQDYDLKARAQSRANLDNVNLDVTPLVATVIITATGIVGSSSMNPAFVVPALVAGSTVRIINQGYIAGRGGQGGKGYSWWAPSNRDGEAGGTALRLLTSTTVINTGVIAGGGGGGGGSSTLISGETYDDPGGSGGGGAGAPPGAGGPPADGKSGPFEGSPGTLTQGGAGGYPVRIGRTSEWQAGRVGGAGGNLGFAGEAGSGQYGFGAGGAAGVAIQGVNLIMPGSVLGLVIGAQT